MTRYQSINLILSNQDEVAANDHPLGHSAGLIINAASPDCVGITFTPEHIGALEALLQMLYAAKNKEIERLEREYAIAQDQADLFAGEY